MPAAGCCRYFSRSSGTVPCGGTPCTRTVDANDSVRVELQCQPELLLLLLWNRGASGPVER